MFNLIYHLKQKCFGSSIIAIQLANTYPNLFNAFSDKDNILQLSNRIWHLHNPKLHDIKSNIHLINDFIFIRQELQSIFPGKFLTTGYSYYKKYITKYKAWFPTIYQSNFNVNDNPSIGYYIRDCRYQSNIKFLQFLQNISLEIPIVTMGDDLLYMTKYLSQRKKWKHTYLSDIFWKSCSHFFYYRPSDIADPFPHTLLEAIQSKHRIISPKDNNRTFQDGIDDLLSCIEYDTTFIKGNKGKYYRYLDSYAWKPYLEKITQSHFSRNTIMHSGTFFDWILNNL